MKTGLLDLLYPRLCGACEKPIAEAARASFCAGCDALLEWIVPPACPRCGASRPKPRCGECWGKEFVFAGAVALGRYEGRLREVVLRLKFRGERHLADDLARRLASLFDRRFDAVAPVPMSRWKKLARHYNASELVAERLAHHLKARFSRGALRKIRKTRPQTDLALEERLKNPEGAYRARKVRGRVLLVDDVLTTGATANACARALLDAGASEVFVAVVAR